MMVIGLWRFMSEVPKTQRRPGQECFFSYGVCTNMAFFAEYERVVGELGETQQIPDFNAFRRCMGNCQHCPLLSPEEPVTEEDEVCVDTYNQCKIDCLAALNQ